MSNKCLQKVVCDQRMLLNNLNIRPNNSLLIFENSNCSVDFNPCTFFVFKVFELWWSFIFTFLIENDLLWACSIINLINSPHVFFMMVEKCSDNNNLIKNGKKIRERTNKRIKHLPNQHYFHQVSTDHPDQFQRLQPF